jgi:hypothetical protein
MILAAQGRVAAIFAGELVACEQPMGKSRRAGPTLAPQSCLNDNIEKILLAMPVGTGQRSADREAAPPRMGTPARIAYRKRRVAREPTKDSPSAGSA